MISLVEDFLNKYNLSGKNKVLLIGFSGGADSTCLTDILYKLSLKYGFKLILCHLNHNWRDESSKSDMKFCKNFAEERNLEFISKTLSKKEKQTETTARELRYNFFNECIKKYNADGFLLAHNKNDNAETLIYRIIKGTGIKGLCAIPQCREKFYRPLLNIERKDIEEYCNYENLEYTTDYTNFNNSYNRNFIRNVILPEFEKINKDYLNSLTNLASIACEEEELVQNHIEKIHKTIYKENKLITQKFMELSDSVKKRIILEILYDKNIDYSLKKINEILEFINKNHHLQCEIKFSVTTDLWLYVSSETIEFINTKKKELNEINITKQGEYIISDYIFSIEKYNDSLCEKFPNDNELKAYAQLTEPLNLTLRTRRDGDIICPLGMSGNMKLKKYLNAKKIKNHNKDSLIFLCQNNEIYWAPGLGISEKIKVVKNPTHVLSLKKRH